MSDRAARPSDRGSHGSFFTTLLLTGAAVVCFLAIDLALARLDAHESASAAMDLAAEGDSLLAAGNPARAVERFTAARALQRKNQSHAIALARALLAADRSEDAEKVLNEILAVESSNGPANLTMARALVRDRRLRDATQYYHRAIFGQWGADSMARRKEVRLELVDQLERRGASAELLAELLPLEAMTDSLDAEQRRFGHLYVKAGSPRRAQTIFRRFLRRKSNDADAYLGLAEAALSLGDFRTADRDAARAVRFDSTANGVLAVRAVVDSVIALDPTLEADASPARFLKTGLLIDATLSVADRCAGVAPNVAQLADSARTLLSVPAKGAQASEQRLGIAQDLWAALPARCTAHQSVSRALDLVQTHLER
jgi:tetratricopeptide (TPR) repeat protein